MQFPGGSFVPLQQPRTSLSARSLGGAARNGFQIDIVGRNMEPFDVKMFAEHDLKRHSHVRCLRLCSNHFGPDGAKALARGLRFCPMLSELFLGNNDIGPRGAEALVLRLYYLPVLQKLDLTRNAIGDRGAEALADRGLLSCPQLACLHVGSNAIGDAGLQALANVGLRHCRNVTSIDMTDNLFGTAGLEALSRCFPQLPQLKLLYLGENRLGRGGAAALILGSCSNLTDLDLHDNAIGDEGVRELLDNGLLGCRKLAKLNLGGNNIGPTGIETLVDRGLQRLSLTGLNLRSNPLGDEGAQIMIRRGLEKCPHLLELRLDDDDVSAEGSLTCARLLTTKPPPRLRILTGITLCSHAEAVGLPGMLSAAANGTILSFLREHPKDGWMLLNAAEGHRNNKDFVLAAVKDYGRAIRYASSHLRGDRDVILHAIESPTNTPTTSETVDEMWAKIESYVDQEVVRRMRRWVQKTHGAEVESSMPFNEVHAMYVSFPSSTAEDLVAFPDLGWVFRASLEEWEGDDNDESDEDDCDEIIVFTRRVL